MSYRFMRVIVMFDLPSISLAEKREYRHFRDFLLKSGFLMMQESVYTKLALNTTASKAIMSSVKKNKPAKGLVQMISVTEKQFAGMEVVVGEINSSVLNSDERLVIF